MVIELERRVYPIVKCVKFTSVSNVSEVLDVLGVNYAIAYATDSSELIVTNMNTRSAMYVREGQYIVNDNGFISVMSAYRLLQVYSYLDVEKGWAIEDDADRSVESRKAFFERVKSILGE